VEFEEKVVFLASLHNKLKKKVKKKKKKKKKEA
jgi:hypothetical protein